MICPTPANEDPCQGEMPKVRNQGIPKKVMAVLVSLHMIVETLMFIMILEMYMFQEKIGELISVEQDGDDYIRPNADFEMKPQIRSKEQLKCMYSEYWMI